MSDDDGSTTPDTTRKWLDGLGIDLERLLGYTYAGLLIAVLAAKFDSQNTKHIAHALGSVVVFPAVIAIGAIAYTLHKVVVGEILLYHLLSLIHRAFDLGRRLISKPDATAPMAHLAGLGVSLGQRRSAYGALRRADALLGDVARNWDVAHGELHFVWITFDCLLGSALGVGVTTGVFAARYLITGVMLLFIGGTVAEVRQGSIECSYFEAHPKETKGVLKAQGFLK